MNTSSLSFRVRLLGINSLAGASIPISLSLVESPSVRKDVSLLQRSQTVLAAMAYFPFKISVDFAGGEAFSDLAAA